MRLNQRSGYSYIVFSGEGEKKATKGSGSKRLTLKGRNNEAVS